MKKVLSLLYAIVLVILSGCASGEKSETISSPADVSETSPPASNFTDLPVDANARGNTQGNLAMGGEIAQWGDWLIYSDSETVNDINCRYIKRVKRDGSEKEEIIYSGDWAKFINVVGNWIYYSATFSDGVAIYKMRPDGSERTELFWQPANHKVINLFVAGEWMYWSDGDFVDESIHKMRVDGTEYQILVESLSCYGFVVADDGYIYTEIYDDGINSINRIDPVSGERTRLPVKVPFFGDFAYSRFQVYDGWIYYIETSNTLDQFANYTPLGIYKIKTDGTGRKRIADRTSSKYANMYGQ